MTSPPLELLRFDLGRTVLEYIARGEWFYNALVCLLPACQEVVIDVNRLMFHNYPFR